MSGRIEFVDIGAGEVLRTTHKAALVRFDDEDRGEHWIPYSAMSTSTAVQCEEGNQIESVRVEDWLAGKMG